MEDKRKKSSGRKKPKMRQLAKINRKIVELSAKLDTLHFMQDVLEREMERDA